MNPRTWTVLVPANTAEKVAVWRVGDTRPLHTAAANLIGCQVVEPVRAHALRLLGLQLLVDEEGIAHNKPHNKLASWLYDNPRPLGLGAWILGDALVVTTVLTDEGPDLAWLTEAEARDLKDRIDRYVYMSGAGA